MTQGRTPLLVLALVILAGLGAGAWLLSQGGETQVEGAPVEAAGPGAEVPRTPSAPEAPEALSKGSALDTPSAREPGLASFADGIDPDDALWIEGRVVAPAGAPRDETLAVVVLGYPAETKAKKRPDEAWQALEQKLAGEVSRARRAVESDGSFRVPVDARTKTAYLYVDGRFAFLSEPLELALGAGADVASVRLEPELGAWLTGTLTIPLAPGEVAGLEGAAVGLAIIKSDDQDSGFAFRFGGNPDRSTPLDAQGGFSFRGLDPDALYDLAFRHDDYLPALRSRLTFPGGAHEVIDLAVDLGGRIAGRVVDERGEPVPGATVRQVRAGFMDFLGGSGRSTTDAGGRYVVKAVRPGEASVRADLDGYVDSEPQKTKVAEGETVTGVELVLLRGKSIAGSVVWPEGEPAANVRVFVEQAQTGDGFNWTRSARSATTGADGRFTISGLQDEAYNLRASVSREPADPAAEGEQLAALKERLEEATPFVTDAIAERLLDGADVSGGPKWTARAKDVAAGTTDVRLTLEPPFAIEGTVRDETGAPVASFTIKARPSRDALQFLPGVNEVAKTFEDPNGAFVLDGLQPGEWLVSAEAEGYAATGEGVSLKLPGDRTSIALVLSRAGLVTGIVLDPTGLPVAGASVQTGATGSFRGAGRVERSKRRSTHTDAEGRFKLENVPAEDTVVGATAEGWAASDTLPIEPTAGGEIADLVLRLKLGGTLTGEVHGAEGPMGACRVRYNSMSALSTGAVTAGADGRFKVEHLTPGVYQVMVEPDPEAIVDLMGSGEEPDMSKVFEQLKMTSADIKEGEVTHVVLGEQPANPVKIFGRLTEAGEPVAGRMVIAMAEGEQLMSSLRMDQTSEDGSFELELKAPGPVVFSVQLDGGANPQFFEDVPEVETWEVELALATGRISGTVFDPAGDPVAGIGVRIASEEGYTPTLIGLSNRTTTDGEGRYTFKNIEPGSYTVRAGGTSSFGDGDGSYGAELRGGVRLDAGRHLDGIDLQLSRPGWIEGHVRSASGGPANGAAIFVRDAGGRLLSPFSGCVTDAAGKFTYEGISPGTVTVSARFSGEAAADSADLVVREGEATRVELQLETGTLLIVSLEGKEGEAQRAQVRVLDEHDREYSGMTAPEQLERSLTSGFSSREHRIGPLPAGRYHVIAITPDGTEHKKLVSLRGQEERRLKIRVE